MIRRGFRTLITSLVVGSFFVSTVAAAPDTNALKQQREAAQSQVNSLQAELTAVLVQINEMEEKLVQTGEALIEATGELTAAEERERLQYADMKLRIKYMYEEGGYAALEKLVESASFGEFLNHTEYVQNVHSYDRRKLDEYAQTKEQIAELKTRLETQQKELEQTQQNFQSKQAELDATLAAKRSEVSDLDAQFAAAMEAAAAEVRAKEEARAQSQVGKESEKNETDPGKVVGEITTDRDNKTESDSGRNPGQGGSAGNAQNGNVSAGSAGESKENEGSSGGETVKDDPAADGGNGGNSAPAEPAPQPEPEPEPAPQPEPESGGNYSAAQAIVDAAYSQLGTPYVWGGNTPNVGLDCSGLTKYCHGVAGITLPRYSGDQGAGGKAVSDPQPGDLVCYAGHVAIYIGGGQMIHAPQPGDVVKVQKVYGNPWYRRYW